MLAAALSLAVAGLLCACARACSCLAGVTVTDYFQSDVYPTIGVFCNGVPSRPYPDFEDQATPVEWQLEPLFVYKGDCALAPGSLVNVTTGANSAVCGVDVADDCYVLGITASGNAGLCGPLYNFDSLREEVSAELQTNDQCFNSTEATTLPPTTEDPDDPDCVTG